MHWYLSLPFVLAADRMFVSCSTQIISQWGWSSVRVEQRRELEGWCSLCCHGGEGAYWK